MFKSMKRFSHRPTDDRRKHVGQFSRKERKTREICVFSEATRQYWAVEITPNSDTLAMNEHKTTSVSETLDTPFQFLRNSKKDSDQHQHQRNIDYR